MSRWLALALLVAACSKSTAETALDPTASPVNSGAPSASPAKPAPPPPPRPACPQLDAAIDRSALERHLDNFLQIAKQHDGNRARGSGGYQASVAYVLAELRAAGHRPHRDGFDIPEHEVRGPGALAMVKPRRHRFVPGRNRLRTGEFTPLAGSPPGEATAEAVAVGVELGAGNRSESGCHLWQFGDGAGASLVTGKIAVLQRGTCPFVEKVENAQRAGAVGVVLFNQGDRADRRGLMRGSLEGRGPDHGVRIPVVFTTSQVGQQLVEVMRRSTVELELATDTAWRLDRVHSVILDIPGERTDEVLMIGGHLDSVTRGPGINDNASGSTALLELARHLRGCRLQRTLRLAWWAAEEEGLLGSRAYVAALSRQELKRLRGYLNLDMIAAPNFAYMLTDGDGSKTGSPAPATSGELEAFFRQDFDDASVTLLEVPYARRSDDQPFYDAGVGVVMLGAGYDGTKAPAEVFEFGGRANEPYDACYHRACDDRTNVSMAALTTITESVARAVQRFAVDGKDLQSQVP